MFYILLTLIFSEKFLAQEKLNFELRDTSLANQYFELGKSFASKAVYDSSNYYYEKSREIFKHLCDKYDLTDLWRNLIACSNKIGWNLIWQDKNKESLKLLEHNLDLSIKKLGDNDIETAQTLNNLATANWRLANYDLSLKQYEKSLAVLKSILGDENIKVANSYINIGNVQADMGNYEKSLELQLKALDILIKLLGPDHIDLASAYNNIGLTCKDLGDFHKAMEYNNQGLSLRIKYLAENHPAISSSYNNLGNIYFDLKQYDESIRAHRKALEIRLLKLGEENNPVAASYNNIGNAFFRKGDYDSAMSMYQKSLLIRNKILSPDDLDLAGCYMNVASVYSIKKDFENSLKFHTMALSIRKKKLGEKHSLTAGDYLNIANLYFNKKDFDSSIYYCQKSICSLVLDFEDSSEYSNPELQRILSPIKLLEALAFKAEIYRKISQEKNPENLYKSFNTYTLAIELIDKIRFDYSAEKSKLMLNDKVVPVYEKALDVCFDLLNNSGSSEFKEKAFHIIEKSKATVLQFALSDSKAKYFSDLPSEKTEKEKDLKAGLAFYETALIKELNKKEAIDSIKISDYKQKLFSLNYEHEKLIKDLERTNPKYYELKYSSNIKSVSEVQSSIEKASGLINFFVGDSLIFIALITNTEFELIRLFKPNNFEQLIKELITSIVKSDNSGYLSAANKLTELLITPIYHKIKDKEKIVIIPGDILFKVPFEALFIKPQKETKNFTRLNYLVKEFDITYHYSATLYLASLEEKNKIADKNTANKNFIGFAPVFPKDNQIGFTISNINNSLLTSNDNTLRSFSIDGKMFEELKFSKWEVNSIVDLFLKNIPNEISTAYFYSDASEENFKAKAKDYKIVHIASHGFINEDQPDISGVIFAQPTDSAFTDDGILYSSETYNLNFNADLIVLSSCESGLGKLFRSEGMIALTRGFLYSGGSNIIFSLWKIPDKHTSELMVEFYRQMISGKTYSESLRSAKLKLIKNEVTARPRSWAGFLMIGSN